MQEEGYTAKQRRKGGEVQGCDSHFGHLCVHFLRAHSFFKKKKNAPACVHTHTQTHTDEQKHKRVSLFLSSPHSFLIPSPLLPSPLPPSSLNFSDQKPSHRTYRLHNPVNSLRSPNHKYSPCVRMHALACAYMHAYMHACRARVRERVRARVPSVCVCIRVRVCM